MAASLSASRRRARAEQALGASEARFQGVFDRATVGMLILDAELRVVEANPAARRVLARDLDALRGLRLVDLLHADDQDQHELVERVLLGHAPLTWLETRLMDARGGTVHVRLSSCGGTGPGPVVVVLHDVTEIRQTFERERRSREAFKRAFLTSLSHELRTPLTAVLGFAQALQRRDCLDSGAREDMARRIGTSARKLDVLLSDLLDLERLNRAALEPLRRPADVAEIVREAVQRSGLPETRPVHVRAQPLLAEVDTAKLERILDNLLSNVARHTPAGTPVWVSVAPQGSQALIVVEDAGPGVPEDLRASLFEPFWQGPDVPRHAPGVGVGLAVVARFAEMHGGRAWLQDRQGGGASFHVLVGPLLRPSRRGRLTRPAEGRPRRTTQTNPA